MPWESRRAFVGSPAATASARTPPLVSGASGNITRASCDCNDQFVQKFGGGKDKVNMPLLVSSSRTIAPGQLRL